MNTSYSLLSSARPRVTRGRIFPEISERSARLGAVLHVLYLMFSEGYSASAGSGLHRTDLSDEVADTDWSQIHGLYELLEHVAPSPVVTLNRAVALAMVSGPAAGLALIDTLDVPDSVLAGHHRLHAVRAHLYEMAGDVNSALTRYREAAALTTSIPERSTWWSARPG